MNCLSTPSLQYGFTQLSDEQKYAFAKFAQGKNVFITGPGGTGKTRLIQFMVEYMNSIGKNHQVCALTGCAATLLNCKAKTIHSWSGIRLGKGDPEDIIQRVIRNRFSVKAWRGAEVLIVDEVSMMSRKMFELLDKIGRSARRTVSKAFGGIQLVFTGDFFQLPPIGDHDDPASSEFCFQHPGWSATFKTANCIELQKFFRQTDPAYISILQEVRRGTISEPSIELLESRVLKSESATKLFPIRSKVDYINESSYAKLEGEERVYKFQITTNARVHIDSGSALSPDEIAHCEELSPDRLSSEVETIVSSLFTEKILRLKIGSLVMCTANIDVDRGICNGSQGVIVGYGESANNANLPDELAHKSGSFIVPIVRFYNGITMKVAPYQRQSEEYPCIVVSQVPLCLAWALTIHKIQGATLDMAEMDIGRNIFASGQTYVALSRVKTLDGLYLSEFNASKIKANPLVVEFYSSFPQLREDEMRSETERILSAIHPPGSISAAAAASARKQTKLNTFVRDVACNPFDSFGYKGTTEDAEDKGTTTEKKDPTIKTIKLSR